MANLSPPWILFTDGGKPIAILPAGRPGEVLNVEGWPLDKAQALINAANQERFSYGAQFTRATEQLTALSTKVAAACIVDALEELDELVDENCKSTSFALAYGQAWETVATKYGWEEEPAAAPEDPLPKPPQRVLISAPKDPSLQCDCELAASGRCPRFEAGEFMLEGWPDSIWLCERCQEDGHTHTEEPST